MRGPTNLRPRVRGRRLLDGGRRTRGYEWRLLVETMVQAFEGSPIFVTALVAFLHSFCKRKEETNGHYGLPLRIYF
jgi:hypothetical protein